MPLSNLPRADLGLRPEMTAVLRRAGLSPADLVTLDELPLPSSPAASHAAHGRLAPDDTRWVLVDHNALTGPLRAAGFPPRVVGCIDHHVDEGEVPADARPRLVEPCGSCMSLIVRECRDAWDHLSRHDSTGDDDLVRLGLAAILLDTVNLGAKEKVKHADLAAVRYLEAKARDAPFDRTEYYDAVCAVKEDIEALPFRDIFRKDYKEWHDGGLALGVSCVVQGFPYLVEKADGSADAFLRHLAAWAAERSLDLAAVMTTSSPAGRFERHLLVWGLGERGAAAADRFARAAADTLRLEPWAGARLGAAPGSRDARFAWRQRELVASRKQVAPLLREAMRCRGRG